MPVEHFRSKGAYMRNLAYRHMNDIPMTATKVCIDGSCHTVQHSKSPERESIDAAQRRKVSARKKSAKKGSSKGRRGK